MISINLKTLLRYIHFKEVFFTLEEYVSERNLNGVIEIFAKKRKHEEWISIKLKALAQVYHLCYSVFINLFNLVGSIISIISLIRKNASKCLEDLPIGNSRIREMICFFKAC